MRVDSKTMVCIAHDVQGCQVCMVDDFHDWLQQKLEDRRAAKAEAKALTVNERFDLGGES